MSVPHLHLARGDAEQAREHLEEARAMIKETGYHRHDGEVAVVEEKL